MGFVRAVHAERVATREAETAQQVSNFLVDLFEVSDPSESRGNAVTAREILDRGAQQIETTLVDESEIQARLMSTMGDVYTNVGLYGRAEALLRGALDRQRVILGETA